MILEDDTPTMAEAIDNLAQAVRYGLKSLGTGDAVSSLGAIEFHATKIEDAGNAVYEGFSLVADAINNLADAVREAQS